MQLRKKASSADIPKWDSMVMETLPDSYVANSNDLLWAVDAKRRVIFANEAYKNFIQKATGSELHADEYASSPDGNKEMADKWDYFYNKALSGEHFHIITNFAAERAGMLVDARFMPLISDDHVLGTACLARATSSMLPPVLKVED